MPRQIMTLQDVVQRLLLEFSLPDDQARGRQLARMAASDAYSDVLAATSRWTWYDRTFLLHCNAPYSTGTIAYDHTGGTYERQLTLTDGTWPTWSIDGTVVIDDKYYEVEQRISDTVITLRESACPSADIASSTAYSLDRYRFDLPDDFASVLEAWDVSNDCSLSITPGAPTANLSFFIGRSPGQPMFGTIVASGGISGRLKFFLSPPPDEAIQIAIAYVARPRQMKIEVESSGTASGDNAGIAITTSKAVFTSAMKGSVLRLSSDAATQPTGPFGYQKAYNPAAFESIIVRVIDSTHAHVADPLPQAFSSVFYTISDPVDVAPDSMSSAYSACAKHRMSKLLSQAQQAQDSLEGQARRQLREALALDARVVGSGDSIRRFPKTTVVTAT